MKPRHSASSLSKRVKTLRKTSSRRKVARSRCALDKGPVMPRWPRPLRLAGVTEAMSSVLVRALIPYPRKPKPSAVASPWATVRTRAKVLGIKRMVRRNPEVQGR